MALNKAGLASDILDLMTQMRKETEIDELSDLEKTTDYARIVITEIDDSKFANALADAIDKFVKTGEVPAGIAVSTTGSATAQTGATTAPGSII